MIQTTLPKRLLLPEFSTAGVQDRRVPSPCEIKADPDDPETELQLDATIIYNDPSLAGRAWEKLFLLEKNVDGVKLRKVSGVNLETMFDEGNEAAAAFDATQADLVFVAINISHLPDQWKRWFQLWAFAREPKLGALVILLGGPASDWNGTQLRDYFEGIATTGSMHMLHHTYDEATGEHR